VGRIFKGLLGGIERRVMQGEEGKEKKGRSVDVGEGEESGRSAQLLSEESAAAE